MVLVAGAALAAGEHGSGRREVNTIIELSDLTPEEAIRQLRRLSERTRGRRLRDRLERGLGLLRANEVLQHELERKVLDVRASRVRLVNAAAEERKRLARTLAHGAVAHLDQLSHAVGELAPLLQPSAAELAGRCVAEVDAAKEDLAQLARGLHPRTLTECGLGPALDELAAQSPLPVRVRAPVRRFPEPVETALWYACSEALANVVKHAAAGSATVSVEAGPTLVTVRVSDDGVGGARVEPGGGLAGLRDRLAPVGGTVLVQAGRPRGTVVDIRVPLT
jgi:signal transduction histidine kinase